MFISESSVKGSAVGCGEVFSGGHGRRARHGEGGGVQPECRLGAGWVQAGCSLSAGWVQAGCRLGAGWVEAVGGVLGAGVLVLGPALLLLPVRRMWGGVGWGPTGVEAAAVAGRTSAAPLMMFCSCASCSSPDALSGGEGEPETFAGGEEGAKCSVPIL